MQTRSAISVRFFFYAVLLISFTSCSTAKNALTKLRTESNYCTPSVVYNYTNAQQPLDSIAMQSEIPQKIKYSERSLMVANATGILKTLKSLDDENVNDTGLAQKQNQILRKLFLTATEIESISAELDCEGERADQIAGFLSQAENQRVKRLTIASIALGAIGGIGNAVLNSHHAAVASAVVGGSLSAALGLKALLPGPKVEFYHSRNLLAEVWNAPPTSQIFSPTIWYMLSEKYFSNSQKTSVGANLRQRWTVFEGLDDSKEGKRMRKLLFGQGGFYSADDLRARARMLNQLQASVKLMNQDLQGLVQELTTAK